jgi:hypothetical protein
MSLSHAAMRLLSRPTSLDRASHVADMTAGPWDMPEWVTQIGGRLP